LVEILKNSIALSEFFSIHANNFSRHSAMPARRFDAINFCRPRKKLVLIMLKGSPDRQ
jgi:hypothetical protein